ncbi:MAG: hypothetical protein M1828_005811 [Chrysothrix sp. TS-e1954]|nr:MAG: hypothetical protein M1828_005811 [Chrysothrix sp. TS-e1954]
MSSQGTHNPLFAASVATLVILTFFLMLRFWSRAITRTKLWWDDWTVLLSMICSVTGSGLALYGVTHTKHAVGAAYIAAGVIPFNLGVATTKLSALFFYARFFSMIRWFRWASWTTGVICVVTSLAFIFSAIFSCRPAKKFFHRAVPGTCDDPHAHYVADAVMDVVLDVVILTLPLFPLWHAKIGRGQKWRATVLFVCGYSVVALSIYRTVISAKINPLESGSEKDVTDSSIAFAIEIPLGIAIVSLPSIRSMLHRGLEHGASSLLSRRQFTESSSGHSHRHGSSSSKAARSVYDDRGNLLGVNKSSGMTIEESMELPIHHPGTAM